MELLLVAVLLGIVEGLTEFLPVSSTGHLIVAGHLLGFTGPKADTFEIVIQFGAILAVVALERRRIVGLLRPGGGGRFAGGRGLGLLALTTLPALAAGYLLHGPIKQHLFGPGPVAAGLFFGGVIILIVERYGPATRTAGLDGLDARQALLIGLFQCAALWPGVSRAAATIVGGLLAGVERRAAVTYSFLAAVPVLSAATAYDLLSSWTLLRAADALPFAVGLAVSFLAAAAAIRGFVALLGRWTLRPFAWYRLAVAALIYLFLVK